MEFDYMYASDLFYRKMIRPLLILGWKVVSFFLVIFLAFLVYLVMKYHVNLFRPSLADLRRLKTIKIKFLPIDFLRWKYLDHLYRQKNRSQFRECGLTLYCGKQGAGKTISMVRYANDIHERFPECIIVANFNYEHANKKMESWKDFMEIRNGTKGVLFLIDEIHAQYSAAAWKDFPEDLLSQVSMQRKQRIKICASSQVFSRVVKPLREQAFTVMECNTYAGRWTVCKEYDADDYELYYNSAARKKHLHAFWWKNFVQSDELRQCYDTYEIIEMMKKLEQEDGFIPRHERGA